MRENLWFLSLFPFFAASNWFYTYRKFMISNLHVPNGTNGVSERNDYNAPNFTLRTRSFNSLCSNLFNMIGVWLMGTMLDFPFKSKRVTRALRARIGIISLLLLTLSIWGGGYVFVKDAVRGVVPKPLIDL